MLILLKVIINNYFIRLAAGFVLSPYDIYENPKVFQLCAELSLIPLYEAAQNLGGIEFGPSVHTICDTDERSRTEIHSDYSVHVYINNELYGDNLYNVILHEMLHALGLKHSKKMGIMNYSLQIYQGNILQDLRRLWLSIDDLNGLSHLRSMNPDPQNKHH